MSSSGKKSELILQASFYQSCHLMEAVIHIPVSRLLYSYHVSNLLLFLRCDHLTNKSRMWANAQGDGRPAEHRWRPLFNAAKFG